MPCLQLTDSHAHLAHPDFVPDLEQVLERARNAGVERVISVSENLADVRRNLALAAEFPAMVKVAAGLYPTVLDPEGADEMIRIIRDQRAWLAAIGEVGLDYWAVQEETDREVQRTIFVKFIELAEEVDLPLNVHSRSAGREVVTCLRKHGARRVQLHAFDGKAAAALPAVEAGYFFSIPPSVVRSRQKQKLVSRLPLSCLLVETDSPVLGPEPGQRNEPANARLVIEAIAVIKRISCGMVAEAVCENIKKLYGSFIS